MCVFVLFVRVKCFREKIKKKKKKKKNSLIPSFTLLLKTSRIFNICDPPKNFFDVATRKTSKVINVVQLLFQSEEEKFCCCFNLLANMIEKTGISL